MLISPPAAGALKSNGSFAIPRNYLPAPCGETPVARQRSLTCARLRPTLKRRQKTAPNAPQLVLLAPRRLLRGPSWRESGRSRQSSLRPPCCRRCRWRRLRSVPGCSITSTCGPAARASTSLPSLRSAEPAYSAIASSTYLATACRPSYAAPERSAAQVPAAAALWVSSSVTTLTCACLAAVCSAAVPFSVARRPCRDGWAATPAPSPPRTAAARADAGCGGEDHQRRHATLGRNGEVCPLDEEVEQLGQPP